jgi:outer membrane immunogenic protein
MMRSIIGFAFTTLATSAIATSVMAADMPVKALPAPPPAPVYNWTGCYVKGGGGYGMWNQDTNGFKDTIQTGTEIRTGGRAWFGTVGGGCDYQVGGRWVIGVFGDYDFSGINGDFAASFDGHVIGGRETLQSAWAVGGRIGYLITPAVLTYVSGGFTEARFSGVDLAFFTNPPDPARFRIDQHTYSGWFLGSGFEYNLGWLPGLFWRTEYRFASYDKDNLLIVRNPSGARTDLSVDSEKFVQTIRSELVWRFNWGSSGGASY